MEVPLSPKRLLSKTCRTCMCKEKDGDQLLQSIFEYPGRDQTMLIADLLTTTTPQLTINRNDRLPKEICSQCLSRALNFYDFQQMCIRSDQHMRGIFELDDREKLSHLPKENSMPCIQKVEDPLRRIALDETLNTNFESELNDCLKLELHIDDENYMYEGSKDGKTKTRPIHVKSEGDSKTPESSTSAAIASDGTDCKTDESDASEHSDWEQENKRKTSRPKKIVTAEPNCERSQAIKGGSDEERLVTKRKSRCQKESFDCPKCGKQFDRTYGLSRHMNVHDAAGKPYECPQCQYRFKTKSLLMSHGVCHSVPTSKSRQYSGKSEGYKCSYCPRRFVKRHSLSLHIHSHLKGDVTSNEPTNMKQQGYNCRLCEETFDARPELIAHLNTHNIVKPYVCEYCNKAFQQSCTLKDHIRTHTGEQPFLCSECGRAFNSSSNMKQHLLRHTGEKRYECPECPKKFPCLSDLASHMAVHKKIKPHVCDICGAAFGKPYQLKKHKMYHNGEKPHKCEYCEMRFVCADHMRRHMRTHTGEKPYKCKYCERAFTQSNDLVKHLRTHVGENVYTCELCPKAFRLAAELRKHFAQHKNDHADDEMEENMRMDMATSGNDHVPRDAIESST